MEKIFIKNRKNSTIVGFLDIASAHPTTGGGLVFILHGVGGFKEQDHIRVIAQSFHEHGYTVVNFDSTNGLGESDGGLERVSATGNYGDLEDVIAWAKTQSWYQEPFVLSGHSLGSMCGALYAEKHPEKVKALAPISTVVSGRLLMTSPDLTKVKGVWEETKWFISESKSRPGTIKKVPWSFVVDVQNYDLLPNAHKLTMPALMAVGEDDPTTPLVHQKKFFQALPEGNKELHVIKGALHTFRSDEHLKELKRIVDGWLEKLE